MDHDHNHGFTVETVGGIPDHTHGWKDGETVEVPYQGDWDPGAGHFDVIFARLLDAVAAPPVTPPRLEPLPVVPHGLRQIDLDD